MLYTTQFDSNGNKIGSPAARTAPGYAPRTPYGRPPLTPRVTTIDSPSGETTRTTTPLGYGQLPAEPGTVDVNSMTGASGTVNMPYSELERRRNEGILPRGPSSQSYLGHAMAFGASPRQPMTAPNMGYGNAGPADPLAAPTPTAFNKQHYQFLQNRHTRALQAMKADNGNTPAIAQEFQDANKAIKDYEGQYLNPVDPSGKGSKGGTVPIGGTSGVAVLAPGMFGQNNAQLAAAPAMSPTMPFTNPNTGAPQRNPAVTPAEDAQRYADSRKDPNVQAEIQTMYQNGAATYANQPVPGIPPKTTVPGTIVLDQYGRANLDGPTGTLMTPTQAEQAVNAGPEQTARNVVATQAGVDRQRRAVIQKNADQFNTNQNAAATIQLRLKQFKETGNYDNSQPIPLDAIKDQRQQMQAHQMLPDGAVFTFNGQLYKKGVKGPIPNDPQQAPAGGRAVPVQQPSYGG